MEPQRQCHILSIILVIPIYFFQTIQKSVYIGCWKMASTTIPFLSCNFPSTKSERACNLNLTTSTWSRTSIKLFHYYKMWVQFISPCSLDQWIHYFFTSPHSLQPMNSLKSSEVTWRTRTPFVVVFASMSIVNGMEFPTKGWKTT